jgi:chorismate mutase/prephenate dehydratase
MARRKKPAAQASDSESPPSTLAEVRRQLDRLDRELIDSMNRRARLAQELTSLKQASGRAVFDPQRESQVRAQAARHNKGPLSDAAIDAVFRELISGTRAVQAGIRTAYLGPEFTFSHLAAIERFGQSAELVPVGTIAAVFEEVERGQAQFGVVPMENSTDGRVSDTLDCFSRSSVQICGELPLRIHHCLLSRGPRDKIRTIYSKSQPLSQCRNWLSKHMPRVSTCEVASTAEAVQLTLQDTGFAAIASGQAGTNYDVPVLVSNIEDNSDNVTRFAIISAAVVTRRTGSDKTALMLEITHQPGALADAMAVFKRNRLNMTWIESFPIPGHRGRYLFFVEFIGHQDDLRARRAVVALRKKALRLVVLGSYAQTEPIG